ncbi:hypothetical protein [Streptomyces sp. NPDC003006]
MILHLQSGIGKFGVADWLNGSAEYYVLRNPVFGVAEPFAGTAADDVRKWSAGKCDDLGRDHH